MKFYLYKHLHMKSTKIGFQAGNFFNRHNKQTQFFFVFFFFVSCNNSTYKLTSIPHLQKAARFDFSHKKK